MVHQYKLNGYNIVMDTASGSVHLVDEVAYDIIEMYENHTKDEIISGILKKYAAQPDVTESEIEECLDDISVLIKQNKLFSEDKYEKLAYEFKNNSNVIKAL